MTFTRWLLLPLIGAIAAGLSFTVLSLTENEQGLQNLVGQQLQNSGVSNPVTAVLLNFRAYDTLLEMSVLLLAVLGIWSLNPHSSRADPPPGQVQARLTRLLVPLLILVSAYLLWAGAHQPGGAFQAGAVLSTAGIILILAGWQAPAGVDRAPLRLLLAFGIAVFVAVGVGTLINGGAFLQYPTKYAAALIMLIESAATVAIGLTLTLLFIGAAPAAKQSP